MTTSKSTPEHATEQPTGVPVEATEATPAAEHHSAEATLALLNECIPIFDVLKDPHRQALLVRLIERGPQTIGELADSSDLSRPTVSHHVKLLEQVGLVSITKVATRRICSARADRAISLLRKLLNTIECDMEAAERCLQAREAAAEK